jgi:hypothetical protein
MYRLPLHLSRQPVNPNPNTLQPENCSGRNCPVFVPTLDGHIAVDQITLIETQTEQNGTPFHLVHYRYRDEMRVTRAHPAYVTEILSPLFTSV